MVPDTPASPYVAFPDAKMDAMYYIGQKAKADNSPLKVMLTAGTYRQGEGKPWVLPAVASATTSMMSSPTYNHEYLGQAGDDLFVSSAAKLILGANAQASGKIASVQTISGTGACHVGALFLSKMYAGNKVAYVSNPSWENHHAIFQHVGIPTEKYTYWDPINRTLDFDGFLRDVEHAPDASIFVLHPCAHNPTGCDPTRSQWQTLEAAFRRKKHFAFFDSAYQGFASGDLFEDRYAMELFHSSGEIPMMVGQSFSKNGGLYGERCGALHVCCNSPGEATQAKEQLQWLIRREYSSPPRFGAGIIGTILNDPELFDQWTTDLMTMATRIKAMRKGLAARLIAAKVPGHWDNITNQQGMFSYTGLSPRQTQALCDDFHVYMPPTGRMSISGLNEGNLDYVAECIGKAVALYPSS